MVQPSGSPLNGRGGAPSGAEGISRDGRDEAEMASLISSSETVPVNTSPEALVSNAATLLSVCDPESKADPGGINSSSGRISIDEDLLILTPVTTDNDTTSRKIAPIAHDGIIPSVDSRALLTLS